MTFISILFHDCPCFSTHQISTTTVGFLRKKKMNEIERGFLVSQGVHSILWECAAHAWMWLSVPAIVKSTLYLSF